jgi:hypothetical protein
LGVENDMPVLEAFNNEDDDGDPNEEEEDGAEEDPWEALTDQEREALLRDTDSVRTTLNKVFLH